MTNIVKIALDAMDSKKAADIVVLDVAAIASFASYFLICTGDSSRQIQAIADEVESRLRESGVRASHVEGYRHAEWVLMDYLEVVVHIFSRGARTYYDLERLWRDGKRLDVEKLLEAAPEKVPARRPSRRKS
jgi:ribosome-associated protein